MHHLKPFAYCGFAWWNNCVQCWFPKWFWTVGQLHVIQNLVWIFPNGSTANTKSRLDTSKWWINGPSKTIWMDLNGSTACYQHCSNGITMCVQKQWAFLKVEILNDFKWSITSISRRVNEWWISWKEYSFPWEFLWKSLFCHKDSTAYTIRCTVAYHRLLV